VNFCVGNSELYSRRFQFHTAAGNIFLWTSVLRVRVVIPNGGA